MAETISGHVARCLAVFRGLVGPPDGAELDFPDGVLLQIVDEQSRFKVWSGNIGAHKTGLSSLDYRLRDASHIKFQVINLLKDLSQLIEDASAIARGEQTPWDQEELEEDEQHSDSDDSPDTELGQIAVDMADVINCLLGLTVTIRNPAPHDRYIQARATDASHFEPFDIQHVRSKFDDIQPWLADWLGKAISRRRQYLRYRHSHHEKLSQGLDDELDAGKTLEDQTVASSIPSHLKEGRVSTKAQPVLTDDASDAGMSQTSYATSMATADRLTIPPLPKEAHAGPFQCCLCYMIIVARDRAAWKKHVYGDLQPYVCLENDCLTPEREYLRRHEWIAHVRQKHWKTYKCISCEAAFSSSTDCRRHLETSHPADRSAAELDALVKLSEQPLDIKQGVSCPLCNETLQSVQQYQRHVGRHQEQLSLFALPSQEADGEADSDEQDSNASDVGDVRHETGDDPRLRIDIPDSYPPPEAELEIREEEREAAHENWETDREDDFAAPGAKDTELAGDEHKNRSLKTEIGDLEAYLAGSEGRLAVLNAEEFMRYLAADQAPEASGAEMEERWETFSGIDSADENTDVPKYRAGDAASFYTDVKEVPSSRGGPNAVIVQHNRGEPIAPSEAREGESIEQERDESRRIPEDEAERIAKRLEQSIAAHKAAEARRVAREEKQETFIDRAVASNKARGARLLQEEAEEAMAAYKAWEVARIKEPRNLGERLDKYDGPPSLLIAKNKMRVATAAIRMELHQLRERDDAARAADDATSTAFAERVGSEGREISEAEDAITSDNATAASISRKDRPSSKTKKTDDWTEVTEPDQRRRIQNRIASRKFREKSLEQKARAARDVQDQQYAGSAYTIPEPENSTLDDGDLSGLQGMEMPEEADEAIAAAESISEHESGDENWAATISSAMQAGYSPHQAEDIAEAIHEQKAKEGRRKRLETERREIFENDELKPDEEHHQRKDTGQSADQIERQDELDEVIEKAEEAEEKDTERIDRERPVGSGSDEESEARIMQQRPIQGDAVLIGHLDNFRVRHANYGSGAGVKSDSIKEKVNRGFEEEIEEDIAFYAAERERRQEGQRGDRLQKRKHEAEEEATEDGTKIFMRLKSRADTADYIAEQESLGPDQRKEVEEAIAAASPTRSRHFDDGEMPEEQATMADDLKLWDAKAKVLDQAERIRREKAAEEAETEYQKQRAELERRIKAEDDARRDEALAEESKAKAALAELERIHAEKKRKEEEVRIRRKVELIKLEEEKKKVDEAKRKEKEAEEAIIASSSTRGGHFDEAKMLEEQETMAQDLLQRFRLAPEAEGLQDAERIERLEEVEEAIIAYKAKEAERVERERAAEDAIAAFKAKETERVENEKQEREAREAELQRLLKERLIASGLNEEQVKSIMRKEKIKKEKEAEHDDDNPQPTYTRMSLRHLAIETLLFYKLDFEMDPDPNYVLIKRWVPEWEQTLLWDHTRKLRGARPVHREDFTLPRHGGQGEDTTGSGKYELVRARPSRQEEGATTASDGKGFFKSLLLDPVQSKLEDEWGRSTVNGAEHGDGGGTIVSDDNGLEHKVLDKTTAVRGWEVSALHDDKDRRYIEPGPRYTQTSSTPSPGPHEYTEPTKQYSPWEWDTEARAYVRFAQDGEKQFYTQIQARGLDDRS